MTISQEEVTDLLDANERMYAPVEVGQILSLNAATIQGMCRDGRIKATKIGTMWRISKSEVTRYIQQGPRPIEETANDK